MNNKISLIARIWLTWVFTKALGFCGAGLTALGLTASAQTPELMAGLVLSAAHLALSWWNTRRALRAPSSMAATTLRPVVSLLVTAGILAAASALTGCATTGGASTSTTSAATSPGPLATAIEDALPLVRTAASVACGAVLDFTVQQSSTRTRLANEMYGAASAVYSLAGGTFPTPTQVQSTVLAFGGTTKDAGYARFASAVSSLYSSYYPKLAAGDAKTAVDLLNAIAGGIEDATASYVTPAPTTGGA